MTGAGGGGFSPPVRPGGEGGASGGGQGGLGGPGGAASSDERDFFQGLVHVAVAWYQAGRGNRVGCERQLGKVTRRLSPFLPVHRQLDVAGLLTQVAMARTVYPNLPPVEIRRLRGTG